MRYLLVCTTILGCGGVGNQHRLRGSKGVAEGGYYDWSTRQSEQIRGVVEELCVCEGSRFADRGCHSAAEYVLVTENRERWRRQVDLWYSSHPQGEPPPLPPPAPPVSCPIPPKW